MGCGCGRGKLPTGSPDVTHAPSAGMQRDRHAAGVQYGTSMLTAGRHLGAASNPSTSQAGVKTSADPLDGITAAMRSAVVGSHVLSFVRPIPSVSRGTVRRVGAVIVPATSPVPVVSVKGYGGALPLSTQPIIQKPNPWQGGR